MVSARGNLVRKKACLVGINYVGTRAELRGCINEPKTLWKGCTRLQLSFRWVALRT